MHRECQLRRFNRQGLVNRSRNAETQEHPVASANHNVPLGFILRRASKRTSILFTLNNVTENLYTCINYNLSYSKNYYYFYLPTILPAFIWRSAPRRAKPSWGTDSQVQLPTHL